VPEMERLKLPSKRVEGVKVFCAVIVALVIVVIIRLLVQLGEPRMQP